MRIVVQRVSRASVEIDGKKVAEIKAGLLVFLGVTHGDSHEQVEWMVNKLSNLRVFEDADSKMNLSIRDVSGEILVVSQFTLYASIDKGRRPSFADASDPVNAKRLYDMFCERIRQEGIDVQTGVFGAKMNVDLINDGPVTIIAEQ